MISLVKRDRGPRRENLKLYLEGEVCHDNIRRVIAIKADPFGGGSMAVACPGRFEADGGSDAALALAGAAGTAQTDHQHTFHGF